MARPVVPPVAGGRESGMVNYAEATAVYGADDPAAPASAATPEPADRALQAVCRKEVSLLAELARHPASGLTKIGPGMYRSPKESPVPDR